MITWENYEEYVMMYADNELSAKDQTALMQFMEEHPELKSELAIYEQVRIVPDEAVIYADKEKLMKQGQPHRIIPGSWKRYAVAAGVAALLIVTLITRNSEPTPRIANTDIPNNTAHTVTSPKAAGDSSNNIAVSVPKASVAAKSEPGTPNRYKVKKIPIATTTHTDNNNDGQTANVQTPPARVIEKIEIAPLPEVTLNTTPSPDKIKEATIVSAAPATMALAATAPTKDFIDKLPLDEANREQAKTIKKAVARTYKHLKNISFKVDQESIAVNF